MCVVCFLFSSFSFDFQQVSRTVPQGLQQLLIEAEFVIVEVTLNFEMLWCLWGLKYFV